MTDLDVSSQDDAVTRKLARHLANFRYEDLPEPVISEARRGILDWLGCAIAGSRHRTLDILTAVVDEFDSPAHATVIARQHRVGLREAALINGQMGHVLDYDDTHMAGVVLHTSSPVLAALLALSDTQTVKGSDFIAAYVAGFDAGVRLGQTSPGHHKGGWHLTGTLGTFAAAAAAGKLLGLTEAQMVHALGISGTQAAGMQQNRGTMCKSFHAGNAAANGVLAARLARRGYDSSQEIVEGKRGFCRIYSDVAKPEALADALGTRWEIARNGHKPYACGVVLHPAIDAVIALRRAHGIDATKVEQIDLRVHPLVLAITGVSDPRTGLKAKFSIRHSAAVALVDGAAGTLQYTDARSQDPLVLALRDKVTVEADETLANDQARATVVVGGKRYETFVEHASGTVGNPMSNAAIEEKFRANAEPVIGAERTDRIVKWVADLARQTDMRELLALCA